MNTCFPFSVLTANVISLLLLGILFLSNRQRMNIDRDTQILQQMMGITAISNVADCCVYYLSGSAHPFFSVLVALSGSWLYLGNVLIGYTWSKFIITHMNIPFTDTRRKIYRIGAIAACALLIINTFYPLVFSYKDGVYRRGPVYSVFLLFAVLYILDSLYLYAKSRKKNDTLELFPIHVFLLPVAIGLIVQAFFIEIAITWTSIAIGIAGTMTALKNETIFLDHLTGLHNRTYLIFLQEQVYMKKDVLVAGIMIDLNGFKQINDLYGHSEGDAALIRVADLLRKSFCEYGIVTRYAGDEFVVILNSTDEQLIQTLIERAKENFEEANQTDHKPYRISASMGYAISDLRTETIDDFMNRIDLRMYQDKMAYYTEHDRRMELAIQKEQPDGSAESPSFHP